MITTINGIVTSIGLPDNIEFSVSGASAEVIVMRGFTPIFRTVLFTHDGKMDFYDLRSILEQFMRSSKEAVMRCAIWVNEEGADSTFMTNEFLVMYSEFIIEDAEDFLSGHFLTSRPSYRISRTGRQTLSWFVQRGETINAFIDAVTVDEGNTATITRIEESLEVASSATVMSLEAVVEDIARRLPDKLVAFTVHRGQRSVTFYVTDEVPELSLSFYNAFNCVETAEIHAVTKEKQKVERSEAHILRATAFYDQNTENTFDVETTALSYEEAVWLKQLFASHYVTKGEREILITDSESDISDSDAELNRAKFTWKYAKQVNMLPINDESQVFSDQFNDQFQ